MSATTEPLACRLVYRHQDFVVVDKPVGLSVHRDEAAQGLTETLAQQLGVPQLWLVHRLDKTTSGLLLLALSAAAAAQLGRLWQQGGVHKTYLALSEHKPSKKQGWIRGDMAKARRGAWKLLHSRHHPAITRFHSRSLGTGLRLFVLHPHTGRTHQLRVAMKSLGSPIIGDTLYGGSAAERVYLHACRLQLNYSGAPLDIFRLPEQGLWPGAEHMTAAIAASSPPTSPTERENP